MKSPRELVLLKAGVVGEGERAWRGPVPPHKCPRAETKSSLTCQTRPHRLPCNQSKGMFGEEACGKIHQPARESLSSASTNDLVLVAKPSQSQLPIV